MNVNYADSDSKGGAASTVKDWGTADADNARHVWFSYDGDDTKKVSNDKFKYNPATNKLTVGSITGSSASCTGNAATASKLQTARTIGLTGDLSGSTSFDGSSNITINASITPKYAGSDSKGGDANRAIKVKDSSNGKDITITYGKAGQTSTSWLASWNGQELGSISPSNVVAGKAKKLETARTITVKGMVNGSATFDGSNNINIQTKFEEYYIAGGNTKNYPFRRFATATIGEAQYSDTDVIIRFTRTCIDGYSGICKLSIRTSSSSLAVTASAYWLETSKRNPPKIYIAILGKTGENVIADLYYQCSESWPRTKFEIISSKTGNWAFYDSNEVDNTTATDKKASVECYTSVANGGTLIRKATYTSITESAIANSAASLTSSAGSSNTPVYFNSEGKPVAISYQVNKTVPSNAVFTDTNDKVTQTAVTASDYTNWRPIIWGASNSATEGFTPTTITDNTFTASTLSVQPSSGTIRATIFKGALSGNASTASTATKLSTNAGSATQPVYFANGKPTACSYTLGKSVPSDAKFTDTVYTLPTASSTLGGVKTTSTVTNASGYTACPIIGGVPYYKDTNTTYSLSSFGINASAAEINYTKGVTSAIQTQLNGKVPTSRTVNGKALSSNISLSYGDVGAAAANHSHSYLPLSGGTVTGAVSITNTTAASSTTTGALKVSGGIGCAGNIYGNKVYGAVWNDYAEYRISDCLKPGRVVCENGDDTLSMSTRRLQPGANIVTDTYGFSIGETAEAQCPIAVSGRVLAYGYEDRDEFRKNIGRPVCAGPNGTVSIMTDEEYIKYGYCAIGTISAVPNYEEWGTEKVKVNNRIWIKV